MAYITFTFILGLFQKLNQLLGELLKGCLLSLEDYQHRMQLSLLLL